MGTARGGYGIQNRKDPRNRSLGDLNLYGIQIDFGCFRIVIDPYKEVRFAILLTDLFILADNRCVSSNSQQS